MIMETIRKPIVLNGSTTLMNFINQMVDRMSEMVKSFQPLEFIFQFNFDLCQVGARNRPSLVRSYVVGPTDFARHQVRTGDRPPLTEFTLGTVVYILYRGITRIPYGVNVGSKFFSCSPWRACDLEFPGCLIFNVSRSVLEHTRSIIEA